MSFKSFDVYRFVGFSRTYIFAPTATDTEAYSRFGNGEYTFIRYHVYSLCRTMFGAGSAVGFVGKDNAVVPDKMHPDLSVCGVLFYSERPECS